jgi:predicted permease
VLWIGAGLALAAAVVLAYVPRLPSQSPGGSAPTGDGIRITPATGRRLRLFATAQIALSFVLVAGAGVLLVALLALQRTETGYEMRQVLVLDVPMPIEAAGARAIDFVERASRRIEALPGVRRVAAGNVVPWRDARRYRPGIPFAVEGYTPENGEQDPHGRLRNVTPGFFAALGVPILAGRDFTPDDRHGRELVVIVSQSVAQRLFANGDAVNRHFWWTDPYFGEPQPRRIVGVVADVDDENVVPGPAFTIYHPFRQMPFGDRLFVHAAGDPYTLVSPVTRIIRGMAADQPVERAATLADVRAEALAPERVNAFVLAAFGGVALLIAVVGVAGVLAFSVSARTREFGVRLAIGSTPLRLMAGVLSEGARIVAIGIAAGAVGGYTVAAVAAHYLEPVRLPGAVPLLAAAAVLAVAGVLASLMPAARASRVDVLQALRTE